MPYLIIIADELGGWRIDAEFNDWDMAFNWLRHRIDNDKQVRFVYR